MGTYRLVHQCHAEQFPLSSLVGPMLDLRFLNHPRLDRPPKPHPQQGASTNPSTTLSSTSNISRDSLVLIRTQPLDRVKRTLRSTRTHPPLSTPRSTHPSRTGTPSGGPSSSSTSPHGSCTSPSHPRLRFRRTSFNRPGSFGFGRVRVGGVGCLVDAYGVADFVFYDGLDDFGCEDDEESEGGDVWWCIVVVMVMVVVNVCRGIMGYRSSEGNRSAYLFTPEELSRKTNLD